MNGKKYLKMKTYKKSLNGIQISKIPSDFKSVKISKSKDAANYMRRFWVNNDIELIESFFLLLLNRANNTEAFVKISQGGTAGTVVDIKIIAKYAVDCLASAVIIAHNHPSGNLKPSEQDIRMSKKVSNALDLFEIKLLDSLIITSNNYFSLIDEGLI